MLEALTLHDQAAGNKIFRKYRLIQAFLFSGKGLSRIHNLGL